MYFVNTFSQIFKLKCVYINRHSGPNNYLGAKNLKVLEFYEILRLKPQYDMIFFIYVNTF